MNPQARKSLERVLRQMERRPRRRFPRFSTAPLVLALGLVTADLMLAYLVPMIWETLLPNGLDQAAALGGWPGLVWRGAVLCRFNPGPVWLAIGVGSVVGFVACSWARPFRVLVWLAAAGVIALDAGILVVTIRTSLRATAASAGLDLG